MMAVERRDLVCSRQMQLQVLVLVYEHGNKSKARLDAAKNKIAKTRP